MSVKTARNHSILVILPILLIGLLAFPLNEWASLTMPRHQLIQLPLALILGVHFGSLFSPHKKTRTHLRISLLILVMASLMFWMLPRSIDLAVINPWTNRIMILNMLICGVFSFVALKGAIREIKIIFWGMLSAMLMAVGAALKTFEILLCSSFNIGQQQETGFYLILISSLGFLITLILFFKTPSKDNLHRPCPD